MCGPVIGEPARIQIDPSRIAGIEIDGECGASLCQEPFCHDEEWITKICEQLRKHRFSLVRLPRRFARLYRTLLDPESYPPIVQEGDFARERAKDASTNAQFLPAELKTTSEAWAKLCESICKLVTFELLTRTRSSPPPSDAQHQSQGMLRVSYNSTAGHHYDNSFVTFMGLGNVKGALQFSGIQPGSAMAKTDIAGGDQVAGDDKFRPCEDFFQEDGSAESEGTTFLIFVGVRAASPLDKEYKPLLHRVEYTNTTEHSAEHRINAIYFLRNYEVGATEISTTHLEIHAWNNTVVNQPEFMGKAPSPEPEVTSRSGTSPAGEEPERDAPALTSLGGEAEDDELLFDWSSGGPFDH